MDILIAPRIDFNNNKILHGCHLAIIDGKVYKNRFDIPEDVILDTRIEDMSLLQDIIDEEKAKINGEMNSKMNSKMNSIYPALVYMNEYDNIRIFNNTIVVDEEDFYVGVSSKESTEFIAIVNNEIELMEAINNFC